MKQAVILLIHILLFIGCANSNYSKLNRIQSKTIDSSDLSSLFKNVNPAPLYKTEVNLYGNKFGGLLLIKAMQDSSYRIVFTTETGIKLFDFELKAEKFTVHFCIDKFNKEAVLATIAADIRLLVIENRLNQHAELYTSSENDYLIYKFNNAKLSDYYFKSEATKKLLRVEQNEGKKQKVVIDLQDYITTVPSTIKIRHKNIRLKIDLKLLER
jgi:hypothetical protein